MALFTKKTKAGEVGEALFRMVFAETAERKSLAAKCCAHSGLTHTSIDKELQHLPVAAVDFATALALGRTPEKNGVLDAFYDHVKAWAAQRDSSGRLFKNIREQLWTYCAAIRTTQQDNPLEDVGRVFAHACKRKDDIELRVLGSTGFAALCAGGSAIFENRRIIP